jgi:hypothetical protein
MAFKYLTKIFNGFNRLVNNAELFQVQKRLKGFQLEYGVVAHFKLGNIRIFMYKLFFCDGIGVTLYIYIYIDVRHQYPLQHLISSSSPLISTRVEGVCEKVFFFFFWKRKLHTTICTKALLLKISGRLALTTRDVIYLPCVI